MPKKDEKPIHGLVSDKNFIVANAVENILAGKYAFIVTKLGDRNHTSRSPVIAIFFEALAPYGVTTCLMTNAFIYFD